MKLLVGIVALITESSASSLKLTFKKGVV